MLLPYYYEGKIEAGCDEAGRGCLAGPVYAAACILPHDVIERCPELAAGLNDSKQLTEKKRYQLRELIERDAVAWAVGIVTNEEIDKINILRASILAMHRALDGLKVQPEAIIVDGNRFIEWQPPQPPTFDSFQNVGGDTLREGEMQPPPLGFAASQLAAEEPPKGGDTLREGRQNTAAVRDCSAVLSPPLGGWGGRGCSVHSGGTTIPYSTIVKGDGKYLNIAAASILAKTYRDDCMKALHEEYPMYHWDGNKGYPAKVHREAIRQHGTSPYHRMTFNLLGESQQLEFQFE